MYGLDTIFALAARIASLFTGGPVVRTNGVAYYDPSSGNGSMLINARDGYGEPMNIIISGQSSPAVVSTLDGFVNYARAIGFDEECFGIHLGTPFAANLGDGNGWVNQTLELRQDYDLGGTCMESLIGGNHFRAYRQNGTLAYSQAWFLAVSKEEPADEHHDIIPDGYDIGRETLVQGAIGSRWYNDVLYVTEAQNITGLLAPGSQGINHGIAQDGIVTLLTVTIL